jgi:hypothetical protein
MRLRSTTAAAVDARLRVPLTIAALLVIPDLILEEQPLRESWHRVAVVANWAIWLAFFVEFAAIVLLASDWRGWMRKYPLALPMLILTPPFAPGPIQALRAFRLLRLLRVARGFQFISKELLTLEGVRYVAAVAVFLVLGGGVALAQVESTAARTVSTGTAVSTEKTPMPVSIKTIAIARPASLCTTELSPFVVTKPIAHQIPQSRSASSQVVRCQKLKPSRRGSAAASERSSRASTSSRRGCASSSRARWLAPSARRNRTPRSRPRRSVPSAVPSTFTPCSSTS